MAYHQDHLESSNYAVIPSAQVICSTCGNFDPHDKHLHKEALSETFQSEHNHQHSELPTPSKDATNTSSTEQWSSTTNNGQLSSSQTNGKEKHGENVHQLYQWAYTTSGDALTLAERLESKKWISMYSVVLSASGIRKE